MNQWHENEASLRISTQYKHKGEAKVSTQWAHEVILKFTKSEVWGMFT